MSSWRPPPNHRPPAALPPPDPERPGSSRPLRARDSMGALNPEKAQLDAAHATGYAAGLAQGREEALDDFQTLLSRLLEIRFGDLPDAALDCIAEAERDTLKRWIVQSATVVDLDELFAH